MKRLSIHRALALLLAAAVLVSVPAPYAEAAKTKTVKALDNSYKLTSKIKKKATTVKKGTTTLKVKSRGYVKFKVPKTKKYTFTFSKQTSSKSGSNYNNAFAYICVPKNSYGTTVLEHQTFSTTGGKTSTAYFHSRSTGREEKTVGAFLTKRSCKLKLKKGTTVYVFMSFIHPGKVNLKIK